MKSPDSVKGVFISLLKVIHMCFKILNQVCELEINTFLTRKHEISMNLFHK